MTLLETLEQEFQTLLIDANRMHWKSLEFELLVQYANMEKKIWEERQLEYAVNNMTRIVEVAESLHRLKEESKTI